MAWWNRRHTERQLGILDRLAHGAITAKPNIARLDGDRVVFEDGSSVHADLVVYRTGYRVTFPFFDPGFVSAPNNDPAAVPARLPPRRRGALLRRAAPAARGDHAARAGPGPLDRAVPRHTMQVDFDDYLLALRKEQAAGAARARLALR